MKLSKAKELIENGTHFLHVDIFSNISNKFKHLYWSDDYFFNENFKFKNMKEIKLSDITEDEEEIIYQFKTLNSVWEDATFEIRIKPDYSKEIEALENKIAELKKLM